MSGTGEGGRGSGFGGGIGRLSQTVGGASRATQKTNEVVPTDWLVLSKDQLRCIVADASKLPLVKDAFGRDSPSTRSPA